MSRSVTVLSILSVFFWFCFIQKSVFAAYSPPLTRCRPRSWGWTSGWPRTSHWLWAANVISQLGNNAALMNHTTYLGDQHVEGVEIWGAEPELHHRTRHGGPLHNPGEENRWTTTMKFGFSLTHLPSGNVVTCDGWNGTEWANSAITIKVKIREIYDQD